MKYLIIIELKNCDKQGAKDVMAEIEDKMLPDYDDTIKKLKVVENKK